MARKLKPTELVSERTPSFSLAEVEGLLNTDNYKRALAISELLLKVFPHANNTAPTGGQLGAGRILNAFEVAFEAVNGNARMVMWADEDFPAFAHAYAKIGAAVPNANTNIGQVIIQSAVPYSPLNDQNVIDASINIDLDLGDEE
ncbi:hypothetical protein [Variovorax sp. LG9.2]|uniref:hypothetical protein n=1 Tax=Variovorax sp. LG9.2 TaxID=3048626 RepID=UPI002B222B2A|nr:hypothetical protein [Variovorax sp. LG9.2]MEB0057302.1 hypothetical protein [Variovorax sp. LG9.2]